VVSDQRRQFIILIGKASYTNLMTDKKFIFEFIVRVLLYDNMQRCDYEYLSAIHQL